MTSRVSYRIRLMYTSDVENRQQLNMLEHRRWQIAHIDFVKSSKQRATTLKSWTITHVRTTIVVGDVGGRRHGVL